MDNYQYVPLEEQIDIENRFTLRVNLEKKSDNHWNAWVDSLPGCAAWGRDKKEALDNLKTITQSFIDAFFEQRN